MKNKTAVDYIDRVLIELIENFNSKEYQVACNTLINFRNVVIKQAKEMEKQQHNKTFVEGLYCESGDSEEFEKYYNETFKNKL